MTGNCPHRWASYFGPVLMCQKCGSTTMVAAAPGESKPIFAPLKASNTVLDGPKQDEQADSRRSGGGDGEG